MLYVAIQLFMNKDAHNKEGFNALFLFMYYIGLFLRGDSNPVPFSS